MREDMKQYVIRRDRLFVDRVDAGRRLAEKLTKHRGQNVLVLGIPRGGVPVAAEVAKALGGELDVIVARKLRAPGSPELAIGAVTANGGRYLNDRIIYEIGVSNDYIERITASEMEEAHRRESKFREGRRPPEIEGRTVIVVDDGLATGATMRAAVRSVRQARPTRVIVAVPVGARESCEALAEEADEVVCPHRPEMFFAIGGFYQNFEPTDDEEVRRLLSEATTLRRQQRAAKR